MQGVLPITPVKESQNDFMDFFLPALSRLHTLIYEIAVHPMFLWLPVYSFSYSSIGWKDTVSWAAFPWLRICHEIACIVMCIDAKDKAQHKVILWPHRVTTVGTASYLFLSEHVGIGR